MPPPYRLRAPGALGPAPAVAELGPLVRAYHGTARKTSKAAAAPFVMLLAYVVWLGERGELSRWFNSTFSAVIACGLFVLSAALIVSTAAGLEVVRVYAHGLVDLRLGPKVVRWDEVDSITAVWSPADGTILRHLLRTTTGETLSLGRSIADVRELVESLCARIAEQDLPSLRARIAQGDLVRFGPVAASAAGLTVDGAIVPWEDIGSLDADDGQVVARGRGGDRLAAVRLDDVPNAFLLAELAHGMGGSTKRS